MPIALASQKGGSVGFPDFTKAEKLTFVLSHTIEHDGWIIITGDEDDNVTHITINGYRISGRATWSLYTNVESPFIIPLPVAEGDIVQISGSH